VSEARVRMTRAFVGLGGNQGDVLAAFDQAEQAMARLPVTAVVARSRRYRTPPWGKPDQADFYNAVLQLDTRLSARALLDALLAIERQLGRERGAERWGPRLLDLDLLLYGDAQCDEPGLRVPHPQLHRRAFVLVPLHELAADAWVPGQGQVSALLAAVDTQGIDALP